MVNESIFFKKHETTWKKELKEITSVYEKRLKSYLELLNDCEVEATKENWGNVSEIIFNKKYHLKLRGETPENITKKSSVTQVKEFYEDLIGTDSYYRESLEGIKKFTKEKGYIKNIWIEFGMNIVKFNDEEYNSYSYPKEDEEYIKDFIWDEIW